ncbi:MAG: NUDIX domain-containing protein, partial [Tepidiformaceae bacterium]
MNAGAEPGFFERAQRAAHRLALKGAYLGLRASWRVYHPITLGVRVILTSDGKVLLVRHTYRPGWFLPGGGVHRRESLERAARREVREEAGAT